MSASRSFRDALANGDIRRVLAAQASASAAQYLVTTALAIHLVEELGAGSLWMLSLRYLPAAVLGPLSAVPTDLLGPKRALLVLGTARGTLLAVAAVGLATGLPIAVIVGLTLVEAACATSMLPACATVQVAVARSPAELAASSALTSNSKSLFEVVGGLLGGFLSALLSASAVFGVSCGVALTAVVAGAGLRTLGARGDASVAARLRAAVSADWGLIRNPRIAPVVALAMVRASTRAVWVGLAVLAATGFLGMGTVGVGALVTAAGVGTIMSIPAGVGLIGRSRLGALLALTIAGMGLPLVLIAAAGDATAALVLIAAWGLSGAIADMAIGALIPRIARGRVSSVVAVNETFKNWAMTAGTLLLPLSVTALGTQSAVVLWGALPLLVVAAAWRHVGRVDGDVAAHLHLVERVRAIDLFRTLRVAELEQVAGALQRRPVRAGDVLVREGEREARSLFILDSGAAEVSVHGKRIGYVSPGESFGEIALMHPVARTATVTATADGAVLELDRDAFIRALTGHRAGEEARALNQRGDGKPVTLDDALRGMSLLAGVDAESRARLAERAPVREEDAGAVLCAEGDRDDSVYVLLAGSAVVEFGTAKVGRLRPGESFGEIAVVHNVPRTVTVRATEAVRVAELSAEELEAALGRAPEARDLTGER